MSTTERTAMAGLRFRLRQISRRFWFLPAVMTLVALGLAHLGTWLSTNPGTSDEAASWIYGGGVEGSRSILAAVASSSIGVGGTGSLSGWKDQNARSASVIRALTMSPGLRCSALSR